MGEKEYRELQLSSSLLVFIFIAILVLGVVIFLLGVSVGKKQAQITAASEAPPVKETTQTERKEPTSQLTPSNLTVKDQPVSPKIREETRQQKPSTKNLYYIQVGAFKTRKGAASLAEKFKKEGFPVLVLEPFSTDKNPVFRTRIGGFSTKEEAEKVKSRLQAMDNKKKEYFIIKG